jgi:hypothetical protein
MRCVKHREILRRERMLFYCNVVQARRARGVLAPRVPGGEKAEAEAEPRFEDGEAARAAPAFRQAVAAEKDVVRLRRAPSAL